MKTYEKDFNIQTRVLERIKIGLSFIFPNNIETTLHENAFVDQAILKIKTYIYKEQLGHKEIKYPADWFEAFKERWFPKSHPIKYKTFKFSLNALYPEIQKPLEQYNTTLKLEIIERNTEKPIS